MSVGNHQLGECIADRQIQQNASLIITTADSHRLFQFIKYEIKNNQDNLLERNCFFALGMFLDEIAVVSDKSLKPEKKVWCVSPILNMI